MLGAEGAQSTGGETAGQADGAGEGEGEGTQGGGEEGQGEAGEAEGSGATGAPGTADAPQAKADATKQASGAVSTSPQSPASGEATKGAVDFKAEYEKLTAPFMANGREMKVESVDDARTLMQMGANYNKKMAALKPNLKLLKLLENNGLLSEEKIGFLIDLEKKSPEAINKLIKDSGIDPMDLDAEKAGSYKPTHRTVSDAEMELDSVLEDISTSPNFQRTIDVVGKEWDAKSKQAVAEAPQLLKVINSHIESGVFDIIRAEVDRERMLGRLSGISDIEAYRQVGDAINARGGFAHLSAQGQQTQTTKPEVVVPAPKKVDEQKLNEKRRAAAPAKQAVAATKSADFNPLALSDDEFQKLVKTNFL